MIRLVHPSDIPSLADVAQRAYAQAFGHTMPAGHLRAELTNFRSEAYFRQSMDHDVILVKVDGPRVLGYAQISHLNFPELIAEPGDELLDRLYVDPDIQGRGIGRALLEAALAHPRLAEANRIYTQVWSENHRALRLYQSVGFEIVGTTCLGVGEFQDTDEYIMVRPSKVPGGVR